MIISLQSSSLLEPSPPFERVNYSPEIVSKFVMTITDKFVTNLSIEEAIPMRATVNSFTSFAYVIVVMSRINQVVHITINQLHKLSDSIMKLHRTTKKMVHWF